MTSLAAIGLSIDHPVHQQPVILVDHGLFLLLQGVVQMFEVDTVFVINSNRGVYPLDDLIASIAWTCTVGSHFTVVVDETCSLETLSEEGKYEILHSTVPPQAAAGFHRAQGLQWLVDKGIAYRQVIMMSDQCMILAQPLDGYFLPHTQKDNVGIVGVRASKLYEDDWRRAQNTLFTHRLPVELWEQPPVSIVDDFMILAGRFIGDLYERNLLLPPDCEKWPGTYGSYMSWLCHLLGYHLVSWGFEEKPLPPLYFCRTQGQFLPAPHLLRQQFLLFGPANGVIGYSERDLRELFKAQRGARAVDIPKFGPIVTGPGSQDIQPA